MMDGTGTFAQSPQRARGTIRTAFRGDSLQVLFHSGSAKALLPRNHRPSNEVVLVNTAGGITGGDVFTYQSDADASNITVTTQAAERAYRSSGDDAARLDVKLTAKNGARLHWLPQETILFDRSHLARRIDVDIDQDSECLILESLVFGRHAMGETLNSCSFTDRWRIRRDGRLVHAEALRLDRDIDHCLFNSAAADAAQMMAVAVYVGPRATQIHTDMTAALDNVVSRAAISNWNGKAVMRMLARDTMVGKQDLKHFLTALGGVQAPRVWQ